jgi:hypothetical protein
MFWRTHVRVHIGVARPRHPPLPAERAAPQGRDQGASGRYAAATIIAPGQALIASTALGPGLGKDQYLKITCADPNHIPSAAKPSAKHTLREWP